ncbi:MAG: hypothetical protein IPH78_09070 [Bacteroidetes bacterium]|nr:hypothetical protein [Bacteroidota bacterium]
MQRSVTAFIKYLLVFTSSQFWKRQKWSGYDGQGFSDLYQAAYYKKTRHGRSQKLEAISAAGNDGVLIYCEKQRPFISPAATMEKQKQLLSHF